MTDKTFADRFWEKVSKRGGEDCWLWQAFQDSRGYGSLGAGRRGEGQVLAHRASYMINVGPIPEGMCVCHKCDVPTCVNPDHLFLGTRADNNRDMHEKGRNAQPQGEAHVRAKLTDADVRAIRMADGSRREIAKAFDVSHGTVNRIVNRKSWRHVE